MSAEFKCHDCGSEDFSTLPVDEGKPNRGFECLNCHAEYFGVEDCVPESKRRKQRDEDTAKYILRKEAMMIRALPELPSDKQRALMDWLESGFKHTQTVAEESLTTQDLKIIFESDKAGFQVTNAQMKGAVLLALYMYKSRHVEGLESVAHPGDDEVWRVNIEVKGAEF